MHGALPVDEEDPAKHGAGSDTLTICPGDDAVPKYAKLRDESKILERNWFSPLFAVMLSMRVIVSSANRTMRPGDVKHAK